MDKWISVKDKLPKCKRDPNALGVPVLIWPRDGGGACEAEGFAYYGRRATGKPAFYFELHAATVTNFMVAAAYKAMLAAAEEESK